MPHTSQSPDRTIDERKRALRVAMRERRCSLPTEQRESASRAAQERLARSPLAAAAQIIGIYASLPAEVSTDALGRALAADGKLVCYPAVRDDVRALDFREAGSDAFRLAGEQPAGPAQPGLHLIDDEQRAEPVAQIARRCQVTGRCDTNPRFP